MTSFVLIKLFACLVTGLLGVPLGILPSVFLFRGLADGVDESEQTKRNYALTLWSGMLAGWIVMSCITWFVLTFLFG